MKNLKKIFAAVAATAGLASCASVTVEGYGLGATKGIPSDVLQVADKTLKEDLNTSGRAVRSVFFEGYSISYDSDWNQNHYQLGYSVDYISGRGDLWMVNCSKSLKTKAISCL